MPFAYLPSVLPTRSRLLVFISRFGLALNVKPLSGTWESSMCAHYGGYSGIFKVKGSQLSLKG